MPVPTVSQRFGIFFQTWVVSDKFLQKMFDNIITARIFTTIYKITDSLFSVLIPINHD